MYAYHQTKVAAYSSEQLSGGILYSTALNSMRGIHEVRLTEGLVFLGYPVVSLNVRQFVPQTIRHGRLDPNF